MLDTKNMVDVKLDPEREIIIPRELFELEDFLKLQDKAIKTYASSDDRQRKAPLLRFILRVNDLREEKQKGEEHEIHR